MLSEYQNYMSAKIAQTLKAMYNQDKPVSEQEIRK
jgi:hypothetical protein